MIVEKTITQTVQVQVCSRPMHWAVVSVAPENDGDEYVIAQFHSEADAKFFVERLPPQGLKVRKIVSHDIKR